MKVSKQLFISGIILFLAVAIGAFAAHGLKGVITGKYLATFETGSRYHFYHGLALLFTAILNFQFKNIFLKPFYCFLLGILLFSFNCYLYAIIKIKLFALIVPFGGVLFLVGWLLLAKTSLKEIKC